MKVQFQMYQTEGSELQAKIVQVKKIKRKWQYNEEEYEKLFSSLIINKIIKKVHH